MGTVTYDERSLMVDGSRTWLTSGEVHYFRIPSGEWSDRLLKCRRAGLNCISTYVPWSIHESAEGKFDFSGDRDISAFVKMAGEHGLYVIIRPGPYLGGDMDFGGLPGWLAGKSGIAYRTANAAFTHYYDKYFRQLLPRLADQQVSRGGNIILIQCENQYAMTAMPDRMNYLEFIVQMIRRAGFDIPITTNNNLTVPFVAGCIETVSACDDHLSQGKKLISSGQKAPTIFSELYNGRGDTWTHPGFRRGAMDSARVAMESLGLGAQVNHYMFCGGSNLGFTGGHVPLKDDSFATGSYDCGAAISESGRLTEKYYAMRLVNLLTSSMGRQFAACRADQPSTGVCGDVSVYNLSGPGGKWSIVSTGGRPVDHVTISLPSGVEMEVVTSPIGAAAIPLGVQLTRAVTLDYSNVTPLGFFWDKVLAFYAPVGHKARVSLNGNIVDVAILAGAEPQIVECEGLCVVFVNTDTAMRTWQVGNSLIIGADYVGAGQDEIRMPSSARQLAVMNSEGKLSHIKPRPSSARVETPKLSPWKRVCVCTEPMVDDSFGGKELNWQRIDRPKDVDRLGFDYGYVWYQFQVEATAAVRKQVFLPDCEDRATIFVNGKKIGIWGRGAGAVRSPMSLPLARGVNRVVMLVDNLGRDSAGSRLGAYKGVCGPLRVAKPISGKKFRIRKVEGFPKKIIPRHMLQIAEQLEHMPMFSAELELPLSKVNPVRLDFGPMPYHAAIFCNDNSVGFFPAFDLQSNWAEVTLGSELSRGKNIIRMLLWGNAEPKALENIRMHELVETLEGVWSVRQWQRPEAGAARVVGKDLPAWYSATFKMPSSAAGRGVYLRISGARKGQIYLNGNNVSRFWTGMTQDRYYLPQPWLKEVNELEIFEEGGLIPAKSRLELD